MKNLLGVLACAAIVAVTGAACFIGGRVVGSGDAEVANARLALVRDSLAVERQDLIECYQRNMVLEMTARSEGRVLIVEPDTLRAPRGFKAVVHLPKTQGDLR